MIAVLDGLFGFSIGSSSMGSSSTSVGAVCSWGGLAIDSDMPQQIEIGDRG